MNNLKHWRKAAGKSQDDLADLLKAHEFPNSTKQKISKIERGLQRISLEEARLFSEYLGCSADDLTGNIKYGQMTRGGNQNIATRSTGVNHSLDALVDIYTRSDPEVLKLFEALRPTLNQDILDKAKKNN